VTVLAQFTVLGRPAPKGSKRHVGHGIMVESSKKVGPWCEAVKAAFDRSGQQATRFEGPVRVIIAFYFPPLSKTPKNRRIYPHTRASGDLDKLLRSTFDALVDVGVIKDDSQVVTVGATKDYAQEDLPPGARIRVEALPERTTARCAGRRGLGSIPARRPH
jgi:crossover junction endodeoxyribonuclease RusA